MDEAEKRRIIYIEEDAIHRGWRQRKLTSSSLKMKLIEGLVLMQPHF